MQLIEGYWKVFVLMGIGYLLHFAPDSWQDACCRGVVKLPLLGKALLLVVLIYLVIQIKSSDIQPFIYFSSNGIVINGVSEKISSQTP